MTVLDRYKRHAAVYGTEEVFETAAADGFEPIELGQLALALRTVDHRWRLDRDQREDLHRRLEGSGIDDRELRRYLGIGRNTLRRMRQDAFQSGESAPKSPGRSNGSNGSFAREAA